MKTKDNCITTPYTYDYQRYLKFVSDIKNKNKYINLDDNKD